MNPGQTLSQTPGRSARCCHCALTPAHSPTHWRQDLSRQTAQLGQIEPTCRWVKDLNDRQVRLQPQSLWGSCLSTLVGDSPPGGSLPASSHRTTVPTALPPPQKQGFKPPVSTCAEAAPPPLQLQRTVPKTLLCKHLNEATEPFSPTSNASKTLQPPASTAKEKIRRFHSTPTFSPNHQRNSPGSDRPHSNRANLEQVQSTSSSSATQHQWMHQMTERTRDRLKSSTPIASDHSTPKKDSPNVPDAGLKASSMSPWSQPIGEPTVPRHQLEGWANSTRKRPTPANSEGQHSTPSSSKERGLSPEPSPSRSFVGDHNPAHRPRNPASTPANPARSSHHSPTQSLEESHNQAIASSQETPPSSHSSFYTPSNDKRAGSDAIAPPATTPSLPSLTPLQTAGLDITRPMIRQQAQEEAIAGEDLDLLANQIKRILDEEARRHGINI